jgi:hypothetical protein
MPGHSDADGNFTFVPCADVAFRSLEPHDSSQIMTEERLQDLDRTISYDHLEDVIKKHDDVQSQNRGGNISPAFPISRPFLAHPDIIPVMPENLQRYSKRPKL